MGIIVLALAILPRLRVGGRQLLESEAPRAGGRAAHGLDPKLVARRLWLLYVGVDRSSSLLALAACRLGRRLDPLMSFYDAVAHAFTTMPTGWLRDEGTLAGGVRAPRAQWIVAVFMIVAGAGTSLFSTACACAGTSETRSETRSSGSISSCFSLASDGRLVAKLVSRGALTKGEEAVRHAVFQAASMMTTTGVRERGLQPVAESPCDDDPRRAHVYRRLGGIDGRRHQGGAVFFCSRERSCGATSIRRCIVRSIAPDRAERSCYFEERTVRAIGAFRPPLPGRVHRR